MTLTMTNEEATELSSLINVKKKIENQIELKELELKKLKQQLQQTTETDIPSIMDSIGIKRVTTNEGWEVVVKEKWRASIPKRHEIEAFEWLRQNGHADLIKRELKTTFGRGEDEEAEELKQKLAEEGIYVTDKRTVHHQTLGAFIGEQKEQGTNIPDELFGAQFVRQATIKE